MMKGGGGDLLAIFSSTGTLLYGATYSSPPKVISYPCGPDTTISENKQPHSRISRCLSYLRTSVPDFMLTSLKKHIRNTALRVALN